MAPLPLLTVWLVSDHQRSPTNHRFRSFGAILTPDHYRRRTARPVSCYALFKWWLLLSQHPGCLSNSTSLVTKHRLWDLSWRSGLFPSRP